MDARPIVIAPGEGHRLGNVEFLARTTDTPRVNIGIIGDEPARTLNVHAPGGFDRHIGLPA